MELWHLQFERGFGWIDNKLKDECKILWRSSEILQDFVSPSSAVLSKFPFCLVFNLSGFFYSFTRGPLIYFAPTGKTIECRPSAINMLLIIILIAFQINTATRTESSTNKQTIPGAVRSYMAAIYPNYLEVLFPTIQWRIKRPQK